MLIVTSEFPPQPGGIGNHASNLAKQLHKNGYHIEVITDQRSQSGNEEALFDTDLGFKVHRIALRKWRLLMYVKRIRWMLKTIATVDVVIASGKFSLWSVAFGSLFFNKQYLAVLHGTEVNFKNFLLKQSIHLALKRFNKLIAVSKFTKSLVPSLSYKIEVIPNGFDIETFNKTNANKDHEILKGFPNLITVGNVTERKGQLQVIKHLPDVLQQYPEIHYHCVGIPTLKENFLQIAKNLKVDKHVTFYGRVSDDLLKNFMQASDIFVMLSQHTKTGDVEGFGIALIEANYLGLPCIGSKGCGIEDAIKDSYSGRLIQSESQTAFIEAIDDILAHYKTYVEQSKEWASIHSWDRIIKQYINVIEL